MVVKNGFNATGKQMYRCNECGRQFVLIPEKGPISDEKKELIDHLLLERISLAGIARVVGVSEAWSQKYVNEKYAKLLEFILAIVASSPHAPYGIPCPPSIVNAR
ncbi:hypothetical protein CCP3SC1_1250003 [Gammaproteobacteria bacterium]